MLPVVERTHFLRQPRHEWPDQPQNRAPEAAAAEVRKIEDITKDIIMVTQNPAGGDKGRMAFVGRMRDWGFPIRKALWLVEVLGMAIEKKFQHPAFRLTFRDLETKWIVQEQRRVFDGLYCELEKSQGVTQLLELDPGLDANGVILVAAGISKSVHHDWETNFPALLHAKMEFSQDLLRHRYEKALAHMGGVNTLLNQIRKRFHLIGGPRAAQKVIQDCFPCAKKSWRPLERKMPEFHSSRLGNKALRAFNEISIDHAGPFHLRQGRTSVEGYVLIIACCATRVVNLEMSLSTGAEHVLAGLQQHIGVFGPPEYINSDRGTGLVKAKRLVEGKADFYTTEGWDCVGKPKWRLNVPYSPTWSYHVHGKNSPW